MAAELTPAQRAIDCFSPKMGFTHRRSPLLRHLGTSWAHQERPMTYNGHDTHRPLPDRVNRGPYEKCHQQRPDNRRTERGHHPHRFLRRLAQCHDSYHDRQADLRVAGMNRTIDHYSVAELDVLIRYPGEELDSAVQANTQRLRLSDGESISNSKGELYGEQMV